MALVINLLAVIRVTPEGSACDVGLIHCVFFSFSFFNIVFPSPTYRSFEKMMIEESYSTAGTTRLQCECRPF
jgi:hypothetical protein